MRYGWRPLTPEEERVFRQQQMDYMSDKTFANYHIGRYRNDAMKAGFYVHPEHELKGQPYIDVKAKEAKVDDDFYDRGDESS